MKKGSDSAETLPLAGATKTTNSSIDLFWLVVSNMAFIFHNIWDNPSHWLSYFSRWLKPPTSLCFWGSLLFIERFETRKDVPLSLKESLVFGVRIAAAFKHFDKDGSGVLEHQEISSAQGIILRAGLAKHLGMGPDLWSAQCFFWSQPSIHGGTTSTTSTTMLWPEAHPSGVQIPLCLPGMVLGGVQQCLGSAGEADHGAMAPWWTQWTQLPSLPGIPGSELSCWGIDVNKDGTVSLLQWNQVFCWLKADQV